VCLGNGRVLEADVVVVGVGARPVLDWLARAPLQLAAGGVAVDAEQRTDVPSIYAAGDVAAVRDAAGTFRRTEHYSSAIAQAKRVAHAVVGVPMSPPQQDWFWSQQYDHYLQYAGEHAPGDELVVRPQPYAAFFLRESVLRAVATVDNGRDLRRALRLLGQPVDPAVLADPAADLRTVA